MSTAIAEAPPLDQIDSDRMTADEFVLRSDASMFELVDGQLQERVMANDSSAVAAELIYLLKTVVNPNRLGTVLDAEACYRCFEKTMFDQDRVRRPDVSFIARGRITSDEIRKGYFKVAPDLAVEVVSIHEDVRELDAKIGEYLAAGVKLVWVINPIAETVMIYRLDGTVARVLPDGELSGESVIPGFRCNAADLFAPLHNV